ncbi:MAG: type IV pilus assembly protein PilM [Gammaproteobacteria bacterium]|nr:type IV pilus assembly protein PilM [Gammaproteobacteria bacterium]
MALPEGLLVFRSKPDSLVGLDIGSTSVKLMELSKRDGRLTLESCGIEPVPPRAAPETHARASGTHISDAEGVGEAIKRLARRTRPGTRRAAVAIGGTAALTKVIEMDASLSDEEMESEIALQASDHLPYPAEAAAIDFEVLHLSERDPTRVEVLFAACRRDDAELLEDAVELGGLKARVLDIEAFALARAFELLQPDFGSHAAIFDIGASSTTLSVLNGDKLVHTREQASGGRMLTEEIQRHHGISATESARVTTRVEPPDEPIFSQFRNGLLDQMARALQFFYSANPSGRVDQVYLAGGVAAVPNLSGHAARVLGVPVAVADPFGGMTVPASTDTPDLAENAPAFMLACGLALRAFEP